MQQIKRNNTITGIPFNVGDKVFALDSISGLIREWQITKVNREDEITNGQLSIVYRYVCENIDDGYITLIVRSTDAPIIFKDVNDLIDYLRNSILYMRQDVIR
jgi:hypothetical protein